MSRVSRDIIIKVQSLHSIMVVILEMARWTGRPERDPMWPERCVGCVGYTQISRGTKKEMAPMVS